MKNLIYASLLVVLMVTNGCGLMSGVKADEILRTMEVIFDYPNKTNDQLYILANTWFVEYFNSDESIIEFQDKENGKIAGKYTFQHGNGIYYYMIKQTISIGIKNEKLKLRFLNPVYKTIRSGEGPTHDYQPLLSQKSIDVARLEWTKASNSLDTYIKNARD